MSKGFEVEGLNWEIEKIVTALSRCLHCKRHEDGMGKFQDPKQKAGLGMSRGGRDETLSSLDWSDGEEANLQKLAWKGS